MADDATKPSLLTGAEVTERAPQPKSSFYGGTRQGYSFGSFHGHPKIDFAAYKANPTCDPRYCL